MPRNGPRFVRSWQGSVICGILSKKDFPFFKNQRTEDAGAIGEIELFISILIEALIPGLVAGLRNWRNSP